MHFSLLIPVSLWSLLALSPVRRWSAQAHRAIFELTIKRLQSGRES